MFSLIPNILVESKWKLAYMHDLVLTIAALLSNAVGHFFFFFLDGSRFAVR
jgi:hypothetical protein